MNEMIAIIFGASVGGGLITYAAPTLYSKMAAAYSNFKGWVQNRKIALEAEKAHLEAIAEIDILNIWHDVESLKQRVEGLAVVATTVVANTVAAPTTTDVSRPDV